MPFHSYFEGAVRLEWAFSISYTEKKPFHIFRGELKIFLFLKKNNLKSLYFESSKRPTWWQQKKDQFSPNNIVYSNFF